MKRVLIWDVPTRLFHWQFAYPVCSRRGGEEQHGAVVGMVSIAAGKMFKEGHEITATLMLLLVFGHLVGVAIESWLHKENLPRSMVTGMKDAPEDTPASRPYRLIGVMMLAAVTAFGIWWFFYALHQPIEKRLGYGKDVPHVAFVGAKLPDDVLWREECGGCHLDFHPSLLPARSWQKMMVEQGKHFGTDLALDDATGKTLLDYMVNNAAEKSTREAAVKINGSIKPGDVPLRITETPYWVKKHRDIAESDWRSTKVKNKVNCGACHLDAEAGTFEDAAMHIPR